MISDAASTEKESQSSEENEENEENISKSRESIIPEDEMIELLEHVPTMLEAVDEDTPLLSKLCESLVTEGLDEESEEENIEDDCELRPGDNTEEHWWHSGGGSPPKSTVLIGKSVRSTNDQTNISEMTIIDRQKPSEIENDVTSSILLTDSDSDEVEIIETVEGAFPGTGNISQADADELSISKNLLREIMSSDVRKRRKRLRQENQTDEPSEESSQSGGSDDHNLLDESVNRMERDSSLSKRNKSNGSQNNDETRTHPCPKCQQLFDDLPSLKVHILTHKPKPTHKPQHNIKWHKCLQCSSQFVRINLLEKHLKFCNYKKRKNQSNDVGLSVDDTSKAAHSTVQNPFSRHMSDSTVSTSQRSLSIETNTDSIEKVIDNVSPIQSRTDQDSADIIEIIDSDEQLSCSTDLNTKVYVCQICFQTIHNFDAFKMHMMTHNDDKHSPLHSCEECFHKFKTRKELDKHFWDEHVANMYDDPEDPIFADDDGPTKIVYTGNGGDDSFANIQCEVCLKLFPNRKTMKNHVRMEHSLL